MLKLPPFPFDFVPQASYICFKILHVLERKKRIADNLICFCIQIDFSSSVDSSRRIDYYIIFKTFYILFLFGCDSIFTETKSK